MEIEKGIYRTRQGSLAEVHFQIWDGTWFGKVNDDVARWRSSGEEWGEDDSMELMAKVGDLG